MRQGSVTSALVLETEVSGDIGSDRARINALGSHSRQAISAEVRNGDSVVRARALSSESAGADQGVQMVQVLEGNEAIIRIGQSVPVHSRRVIRTSQDTRVTESVEYRDADQSIRVRPRVNGNLVTLEISSRQDSLVNPDAQTIKLQRIDAVTSGRLGDWMEIGGVDQSQEQTDGRLLSRQSSSLSDAR